MIQAKITAEDVLAYAEATYEAELLVDFTKLGAVIDPATGLPMQRADDVPFRDGVGRGARTLVAGVSPHLLFAARLTSRLRL